MRTAPAGAGRARAAALALTACLGMLVGAACCPVAAQRPAARAALRARLLAAPGGGVMAVAADGRRVLLDLTAVGPVAATGRTFYLGGTWLQDGRLAVTTLRALDVAASSAP